MIWNLHEQNFDFDHKKLFQFAIILNLFAKVWYTASAAKLEL